MGTHIWECSHGHIHVIHNGRELWFEDIYEMVSSLEIWLEYAMLHEMETAPAPQTYWDEVARSARN